jgi:hypothetical protein
MVPVSNTAVASTVKRAPIDDFLRYLEREEFQSQALISYDPLFISNTLDLVSDVVILQSLEKAITEYLSYKHKSTVAVADVAN